jgi:heme/copper-type cytochrome/quinol oxidase subunit 2
MPHHLIAALLTFGLTLRYRAQKALARADDEGASTIEIVFWSVGLLVLAGLVYAAIQAYVNGKIPGIS